MKTKILVFLLTLVMIFSATGIAFADIDLNNPPTEISKPQVENYQDNEKIKEYNEQAEEYNKQAIEYNKAVDKEYEDAVKEIDKQNAEGLKREAESKQAQQDAITQNEQATIEAEEQNAQIDQRNQEELERVTQHNALEDEKAQAVEDFNQSESVRIEQENQQKQEQYEQDLAQYNTDKYYEDWITSHGYESVDAYNNLVNTYLKQIGFDSIQDYTNARTVSIINNGSSASVDVDSTYDLQEAENKSGETLTVYLTHNFLEIGVTYTTTFQIDKNDIITFNALGASLVPTREGLSSFYYTTDNSHLAGYWYEGWSYCGRSANFYQETWNNGDSHTVSLKDGTKYASDSPDIYMDYYYFWNSYPNYKNYNNPIKPDEPDFETFIPQTYEQQYLIYEPIEHVLPNLIEVPEIVYWTMLQYPDKRPYLTLLDLLDLFKEPTLDPIVNRQITYQSVAFQATPTIEEHVAHTSVIGQSKTPFAEPEEIYYWALLNLILTILTVIISLIFILSSRDDDDDDNKQEENEDNEDRTYRAKILTGIISFISCIVFILTEDITLPMQWIDQWTLIMAIIFVCGLGTNYYIYRKNHSSDNSK